MPEISVVIPSFNHAAFIVAALESLEAQTFRDFEVVVVDDGSTDDSAAIVRRFAETCRFELILIEQPNAGAHAAIERAIAEARAAHVAILNSDDLFHPERLAAMMAAVPREGPYVAFSGFEFIDGEGRAIPDDPHNLWYRTMLAEHAFAPGIGFTLIKSNISISTSNFVFSKAMHALAGPFEPYRTAHDLDFLLRCVRHVEPIFLQRNLFRYRLHGRNTITANRDLERREVRSLIEAYVRAVTSTPPANPKAPGARELALYSQYFLVACEHWFGACAGPAELDALAAALRTAPASCDAQALAREVERLTRALDAERFGHAEANRRGRDADNQAASVAAALDAVHRSTSWRITKPLRRFGRHFRRPRTG